MKSNMTKRVCPLVRRGQDVRLQAREHNITLLHRTTLGDLYIEALSNIVFKYFSSSKSIIASEGSNVGRPTSRLQSAISGQQVTSLTVSSGCASGGYYFFCAPKIYIHIARTDAMTTVTRHI